MYGSRLKFIAAGEKPNVLPASSVPPVTVKREVLTIDKIGVGQTFIVHGKPDEVYVKISNSHVFNHKRLQMHTTVAERFKSHLNLVVVELRCTMASKVQFRPRATTDAIFVHCSATRPYQDIGWILSACGTNSRGGWTLATTSSSNVMAQWKKGARSM
ncbi:endolysin [Enterobacter phage 02_vB_Eclo_IJM]|nr:endolysin [Enterobacter phage 02_vB_Eclo_IJM]